MIMCESTFSTLFIKKYITNFTEFTVSDGHSGTMVKAVKKDGTVKFLLTGKMKVYNLSDITLIDGMEMSKFCQAYNLEANGDYSVVEIEDYTDCVRDIIGKKYARIGDLILENDMKLWFKNEVNLEYNQRLITVVGVGEQIRLNKRGRPKLVEDGINRAKVVIDG
jgi:hypothetical protein